MIKNIPLPAAGLIILFTVMSVSELINSRYLSAAGYLLFAAASVVWSVFTRDVPVAVTNSSSGAK